MKITVQTAAFARELFKANNVSGSKSTMPILQNIILEATDDQRVRILITDLENILITELSGDDVKVTEPGKAVIRIKELYETINRLRSPELHLETDEQGWLTLQGGSVKARFVGANYEEYPAVAKAEDVDFFEVPTDKFLRMIGLVSFSVSRDSARPHLSGANLHIPDTGKLCMVSTDGHRLSVASFDYDFEGESPSELKEGVIVPLRGLERLQRMTDATLATLRIGFWNSNIVFEQEQTQFIVRLIEGSFPSYKQVIPAEREESRAIIDRAMLADRLKLVALFANANKKSFRIELSDGNCALSAHDPEKGECEEEMPVNYNGPTVKAGFNVQYVADVLSALNSPDITIEVTDALKPAIIRATESREGEDAIFIVMPMRI